MADPRTFSQNILKRAEQVIIGTRRAKLLAATAAGRSLAENTPRASGLAASNYVASVGGPDLSLRPIQSVGSVVGAIEGVALGAALEDTITIANGGEKIPYLRGLNNGNSQKAPMGFLQQAAHDGLAVIRGFRLLR